MRLSPIRGGNADAEVYRIHNMPRASVYRAAALALPTAGTAVIWDTKEYDNDSMWNPSFPTRLRANSPGLYVARAAGGFAANAASFRQLYLQKTPADGTAATIYAAVEGYDPIPIGVNLLTEWPIVLNKDDYVEVFTSQGAGAGLAFTVATATLRTNGFTLTFDSTIG